MAKQTAHAHRYDLLPNDSTRVACLDCGFAVPLSALKSRGNLDSITARRNATPAVREAIERQSEAIREKMENISGSWCSVEVIK
jgi:hypothetical protein